MKISIFGSGAVGRHIDVQLQWANADVSPIARGPHLAAMRDNGPKLLKHGEEDGDPGVPIPTIDAVRALVKQRAQNVGQHQPLARPARATAGPKEYATVR